MNLPDMDVDNLNDYLNTVSLIEPGVAPLEADVTLTSIAISLRRIVDALERIAALAELFSAKF